MTVALKKLFSSLLLVSLITTTIMASADPYQDYLDELKKQHKQAKVEAKRKRIHEIRRKERLKKIENKKVSTYSPEVKKPLNKGVKQRKVIVKKRDLAKAKRKKALAIKKAQDKKVAKAKRLANKKAREKKARLAKIREKAEKLELKKQEELAVQKKVVQEKALAERLARKEQKRIEAQKSLDLALKRAQEEAEYFTQDGKEYKAVVVNLKINYYSFPSEVLYIPRGNTGLCAKEKLFSEINAINLETKIIFDNQEYVCLTDTGKNISLDVNYEDGEIDIMLSSFYFKTTNLAASKNNFKYKDYSSSNGARLDYQAYHMQTEKSGNLSSLLLSPNLFSKAGVTFRSSHLLKNDYLGDKTTSRQETSLRYDDVDRIQTYILGDYITSSGSFGNSFRGGGFQFSKNFNTRPTLITYPTFNFKDQANLPSTVDLYVNNVRAFQEKVNEGPLNVDYNNPTSGSGQATLLIRDITGKEKKVKVNFYSEKRLLQTDVSDYSFSIGKLRRNYSAENGSDTYDNIMTNAVYKRGITDTFTTEAQVNTIGDKVMFNTTGIYLYDNLFTTSFSYGHIFEEIDANLYKVSIQRQTPVYNILLSHSYSDKYLDVDDDFNFNKHRTIGSASWRLKGDLGSIQASLIDQESRAKDKTRLYNLNYNKILFKKIYMSLRYSRQELPEVDNIYSVLFSMPLGDDHTGTLDAVYNKDGINSRAVMQKNQRNILDLGYRLEASHVDDKNIDDSYQEYRGTINKAFDLAELSGEAGKNLSNGYYAAAAVGGSFIYMEDKFKMSRPLGQSFAMVDIDGVEGVEVVGMGQVSGKTDKDGVVLVSNLTPYYKNNVSVSLESLPLNVSIANNNRLIIPRFDSGVLYKVKRVINKSISFNVTGIENKANRAVDVIAVDMNTHKEYKGIMFENEVYFENIGIGSMLISIEGKTGSCSFVKEVIDNKELLDIMEDEICKKGK